MRYPSLEPLLNKIYFDGLLSPKIDELEKNLELAKNKNIQITSQFEIPIGNEVKRFETQVIPEIRDSCQLIIKEIRNRIRGTEGQLLDCGYLSNSLKEILIFVRNENDIQKKNPDYPKICKTLKFTRQTARIKIQPLIEKGYLRETIVGRIKEFQITEAGRNILKK